MNKRENLNARTIEGLNDELLAAYLQLDKLNGQISVVNLVRGWINSGQSIEEPLDELLKISVVTKGDMLIRIKELHKDLAQKHTDS